MAWHTKTVEQVLAELETSAGNGLDAESARRRLDKHGPNELEERGGRTITGMAADQFKDLFIVILIAAACAAWVIGDTIEAAAIMAIVLLNAALGFAQQYRAEKAVAALRGMAAPEANLLRDARRVNVPASGIVPGDIVFLEAGDIVPADMRLIEAAHLRADESSLTGESVPVDKTAQALEDEHLSLGDRRSMAYSGTVVTAGRGRGVVIATGMRTEMGSIAHMVQGETGERTPLQVRLQEFGKQLALAIFCICAVIFAAGLLRGQPVMLMLLTAVSLAVAAVPEALPAVTTISLALGARKMVGRQALIRRLPAVETLGSVTYICSDKTGTLTRNEMTVERIFCNGERFDEPPSEPPETFGTLLRAIVLCNDAHETDGGDFFGDPTEIALLRLARRAGLDVRSLSGDLPRTDEIAFSSERKAMTTLHCRGDGALSCTKGAPEAVLSMCATVRTADGVQPLDRGALEEENERMAGEGLRVLAVAVREWDEAPQECTAESVEQELCLLGLVGMIDPPRDEARGAVELCANAGITAVMITGDHPATAHSIGRRLGIVDGGGRVLTGSDLSGMTPERLGGQVVDVRIYARIAPEQKLSIVKALQDRHHFVAVTGDGVNDAPALRAADIGVAMGITGTDVSRESADMILLDDNFATLVNAVREGRRIYDNILKFITYSLGSNAGTLLLIFLAPFFGLPLPLMPIQILWINLLCDSLPGLALTAEPADADVMERPPHPPREGVLARGRGRDVLLIGSIVGLLLLGLQAVLTRTDMPWQTVLFTSLILGRIGVALSVSTPGFTLFRIRDIIRNRFLVGSAAVTALFHFAIVYLPFARPVFETRGLGLPEVLLCLGFAVVSTILIDIRKIFARRRQTAG